MTFGIIGSGSWGTAIAKILSDNGHQLHWWNRSENAIEQFKKRSHNPQYLPSAKFDMSLLNLSSNVNEVILQSDIIIIAVPSAFVVDVLSRLPKDIFRNKKILSAVKGILPEENLLLNDYLNQHFDVALSDYFAVLGPCHAEEVAAEKLSYLTFSGINESMTNIIADNFKSSYLRTIVNKDIYGVQYAAILKNIYAVGSGIAHGLDYGDNFLSVLIANSADEMAGFLRKAGIINAEVGYIDHKKNTPSVTHNNYAASVYMGDLLVTCYSLHSRNRSFGNMIGKGYGIKAAQLELSMVAEGYNAARCMYIINQSINADMPIAEAVYKILWQNLSAETAFREIEDLLV
jgi:glycerol-3-phosphate dehydrogenase (NAD(P)+)